MLNVADIFIPQNFISGKVLSFPFSFEREYYTNYVKQRKKKHQEIFQKTRCAIILALIQ